MFLHDIDCWISFSITLVIFLFLLIRGFTSNTTEHNSKRLILVLLTLSILIWSLNKYEDNDSIPVGIVHACQQISRALVFILGYLLMFKFQNYLSMQKLKVRLPMLVKFQYFSVVGIYIIFAGIMEIFEETLHVEVFSIGTRVFSILVTTALYFTLIFQINLIVPRLSHSEKARMNELKNDAGDSSQKILKTIRTWGRSRYYMLLPYLLLIVTDVFDIRAIFDIKKGDENEVSSYFSNKFMVKTLSWTSLFVIDLIGCYVWFGFKDSQPSISMESTRVKYLGGIVTDLTKVSDSSVEISMN